ncbi:MAG: hypothetical protein V1822_00350 [Candidatus Micrarchaeota archaeon]
MANILNTVCMNCKCDLSTLARKDIRDKISSLRHKLIGGYSILPLLDPNDKLGADLLHPIINGSLDSYKHCFKLLEQNMHGSTYFLPEHSFVCPVMVSSCQWHYLKAAESLEALSEFISLAPRTDASSPVPKGLAELHSKNRAELQDIIKMAKDYMNGTMEEIASLFNAFSEQKPNNI